MTTEEPSRSSFTPTLGRNLDNDAEGEPVVVGKVGTRCVYATNYERGYVVVAAPQRFSRPHRVRGVNDE